jgi:leader peptidase (prepilin peptidase)/N-methyltransferase
MHAFWIFFLFLFGAATGSFLNVVIYRMPRGESINFPRSHCTVCGKMIAFYDNIPILSWLVLRGRCRHCKTPISPRYLIIETLTGLMFVGLYVAYYMLDFRVGSGTFEQSYAMYVAHVVLLSALLACSLIDIAHWIVPLEVCWFASVVAILAATLFPHEWMPAISPGLGAGAIGAMVGLFVALGLERIGVIQPSFLDADDKPFAQEAQISRDKAPKSVAAGKSDQVDPRREILREVVFLLPAGSLAFVAWASVTWIAPASRWWASLHESSYWLGPRLSGLEAALLGYLVGGLWIWGTRILGTLGFGKEAMGLGDVHILAAVGAATGWVVPSVAFLLAPFYGLLWALYLVVGRNQRELPYGPWLALASVTAMLAHDPILALIRHQFRGVW